MQTYDLRISAAHREYLLTALIHMLDHPTCLGADESDREEIDLLKGMLEDAADSSQDIMNDFTA